MTTQGSPVPNFALQNNNLPFTIQYSSYPTSQLSCQNNINAIPNGPIFPTKPIFPSSLPPSLSQYPSSLQTNFINVKREACICTLRTSNLIIDSGFKGSTFLRIKNIPDLTTISADKKYYNLVVDDTGRVFQLLINNNNRTSVQSNTNVSVDNPSNNVSTSNPNSNFNDPIMFVDDM